MDNTCPTCKGTILPRAQNGAARGTCNCQPGIAPRAVRTEGWEPSGSPRLFADLERHAVVQFGDDPALRRIEHKTTTGVKLVRLHGAPDPIVAPLSATATPFAYVKRRL